MIQGNTLCVCACVCVCVCVCVLINTLTTEYMTTVRLDAELFIPETNGTGDIIT